MSYLKPQNPIQLGEDYIYPLTTSDQVILNNGNRLNSLFKKIIKENITLLSSGWSETLPYIQTVTLNESTDDYNVDANVVYGGDNDVALNKAASCISYIKKNHKEITFYCLKKKPEIDIPVEVTGTCRNTIATVEEGIKLNFDVVAYGSEEELLADTPAENTIGIITDTPITGYHFSATEPENMNEGEVWIKTEKNGIAVSDIVDGVTVYPISAKQYVSGARLDVTAMIYQGSEWIELIIWLYRKGNLCETISGGWEQISSYNSSYWADGTVAFNADNVTLTTAAQQYSGIVTKNKIDLTNIKSLKINVKSFTAVDGIYSEGIYCLFSITNQKPQNGSVASVTIPARVTGSFEIDLTAIEGSYYVLVSLATDTSGEIVVDEVKCCE